MKEKTQTTTALAVAPQQGTALANIIPTTSSAIRATQLVNIMNIISFSSIKMT